MSGQRYRDRLRTWRTIWCIFIGGVFCLYLLGAGFNGDFWSVFILLAVVGVLGWPRNMAKILARLAQRTNDLYDAVDDERRN